MHRHFRLFIAKVGLILGNGIFHFRGPEQSERKGRETKEKCGVTHPPDLMKVRVALPLVPPVTIVRSLGKRRVETHADCAGGKLVK